MKINAISLNHTRYYNVKNEDKRYIKEIRSTYIYDPESGTYLCELTPSYDLRFLHTFIVWDGDPSEETRAELDETYCYTDNEDVYMHVSDVRNFAKRNPANAKECGEFDDTEEAREYLNGNWPF